MKEQLLTNWHILRIVRLLFGVFLIFQAIETRQYVFFAFAAFFLFQAIFNQGCSANGCAIPTPKKKENEQ